jgi:hypothetical protein
MLLMEFKWKNIFSEGGATKQDNMSINVNNKRYNFSIERTKKPMCKLMAR